MIGVVWALLSSALWGGSDFVGGLAARRSAPLPATVWAYVGAGIVAVVVSVAVPGQWSSAALIAGSVAALSSAVGFLAFYLALISAPIGVASVIVGATEAVVPLFFGIVWRGQAPTAPEWAGVLAAIVGAALIGSVGGGAGVRTSLRPLMLAVAAGVAFGVAVVGLSSAPSNSGFVAANIEILEGLVLLTILWLAVARSTRGRSWATAAGLLARTAKDRSPIPIAICGGFVLAIANLTLVIALRTGPLAVVGVVVSLYPITATLLARVVLHEYLTRRHVMGISLALSGCVLLAL